jgi:hypothetical protein
MTDYFDEMREGSKETSNGFRVTVRGLTQAVNGLNMVAAGLDRITNAIPPAREEQEDMRETLRRLEVTVLELVNRLPPHERNS